MHAIDASPRPWPLHTSDATRRLEADAQAALPPHALMQRAGLAVARLALAVAPHAGRCWIAVGSGNNGGDGLEAALHLQAAGKAVEVRLIGRGPADRRPDDAAASLARAQQAGITIVEGLGEPRLDRGSLAIDALLGLGARRPPAGEAAAAVACLQADRCDVLAVDVPTGLDGDTGALLGDTVVRASHTLALLTLKPGLHTGQGRDAAGRIWLDTLGIQSADGEAAARLAGAPQAPARRHAQHKGSFGDVQVYAGAPGMTGAALLAARAAHAAGAGRVHVALLDPRGPAWDELRPELMFRRPDPADLGAATVLCGCGGGQAVRSVLPALLERAPRLLLDADALNAIAADPELQVRLQARAPRGQASLLTPHPLEAARLLGRGTAAVQADRLATARELAARCGAVVVLKGSGSVVAAPGWLPSINPTGSAALATAGTGDVLAGWIAGLWAQQPSDEDEMAGARRVAEAGVYLHGAASGTDRLIRAGDLIERLHEDARG